MPHLRDSSSGALFLLLAAYQHSSTNRKSYLSLRHRLKMRFSCRAQSSRCLFSSDSGSKSSWKLVTASSPLRRLSSSARMAYNLKYLPATYKQGMVQFSKSWFVYPRVISRVNSFHAS